MWVNMDEIQLEKIRPRRYTCIISCAGDFDLYITASSLDDGR